MSSGPMAASGLRRVVLGISILGLSGPIGLCVLRVGVMNSDLPTGDPGLGPPYSDFPNSGTSGIQQSAVLNLRSREAWEREFYLTVFCKVMEVRPDELISEVAICASHALRHYRETFNGVDDGTE